jgi:hypothetical protein
MHVTLDQDQWDIGTGVTLGEVLADISERAHARAHIVTSLRLDQRIITDRDLDPGFLGEPATHFTVLTASSQSMQDIVHAAQTSARRYAQDLGAEGTSLVRAFRTGVHQFNALDQWLGKLADYLELMERPLKAANTTEATRPLSSWVQELLDARNNRDVVLTADLLEYEILPRLEA